VENAAYTAHNRAADALFDEVMARRIGTTTHSSRVARLRAQASAAEAAANAAKRAFEAARTNLRYFERALMDHQNIVQVQEKAEVVGQAARATREKLQDAIVPASVPTRGATEVNALHAASIQAQRAQALADEAAEKVAAYRHSFTSNVNRLDEASRAAFERLAAQTVVHRRALQAVDETSSIEDSASAIAVVNNVTSVLQAKGYERLVSGGSHQWGKMTLSLWQQATCVKTTIVNETSVVIETLTMRPIFSGATADSIDRDVGTHGKQRIKKNEQYNYRTMGERKRYPVRRYSGGHVT
jgi:hypothetical protein